MTRRAAGHRGKSLTEMAGRRSPGSVQAEAAGDANLPPADLRRLARSRSWNTRAAAATNPTLPTAIADKLARDKEWAVRHQVASSPNLSATAAGWLADDLAAVRLQLAANPNIPEEVARRLANDTDQWVRNTAAGLPALGTDDLRQLAGEFDAPTWVLQRIAKNPSCPETLADEIFTWLVLGGGEGHATFDPVTCTGNPGDEDEHQTVAYRRLAEERAFDDPHPLALARCHQGETEDDTPWLTALLLADPDPRVRYAVLQRDPKIDTSTFNHIRLNDPDTLVGMRLPAEGPRREPAWVGAAILVSLLVLGYLASRTSDAPAESSVSLRQPTFPLPLPPSGSEASDVRRISAFDSSWTNGETAMALVEEPTPGLQITTGEQPVTVQTVSHVLVEWTFAVTSDRLPVLIQPNSWGFVEIGDLPYLTTEIHLEITEGDEELLITLQPPTSES